MTKYSVQKILTCLALGLTLSLPSGKANALILGSETPTSFSLNLTSNDFPPIDGPGPGLDWYHRWTIFDGQYWNVKTFAQAHGPRIFLAQYVDPNLSPSPYATLPFQPFTSPLNLYYQNPDNIQASYIVHSSFDVFNDYKVNCEKGTPDCAFFELLHSPIPVLEPGSPPSPVSVEINGFYQPPEGTQPVPEPSTEISSLVALCFIGLWRFQKRLSQNKTRHF